ncbi:MAG: tRNA uridine-5-carboxymethylaminomethyl(34) synthesis enzyme MnmG [Clostridia bacterium]|nr:tRNA uridine-5-carboxymethylaminomethyl(34) synthesis enzyme MnmG [Clostridia bacterium]
MKGYFAGEYAVIVVGAGHAGIEAALACARMGLSTLCLTINLDAVGLMACNPAIGGTSKGHLVREIDAMGGEMGLATDEVYLQLRMLNTAKGSAVWSLRAQADKRRYHERMKRALEQEPLLDLKMGECERLLTQNGRISGVAVTGGAYYTCRAVVLCTGVYLKSHILVGDYLKEAGPSGMLRSEYLSASLEALGFPLRRFKTGTPPRVHKRSLDVGRMEPQRGDVPTPHFSFMTDPAESREQTLCYLTYTNARTHEIILNNIERSAMYSGLVKGTGTRYCPSIEDKIKRFADKDRHQLFIEPEGKSTEEMYVQGMSTSLPYDVQVDMLRTIEGMERCEIMRPGYAIEYDVIDSTQLTTGFEAKDVPGLFFAGQLNGSSGYEEAAAQGFFAGVNAALFCKAEPPFLLKRSDAYIGVLVDDLATKGTNEPYRMMTSRAEYRLLLRQDNADLRLTERARRLGLISDARYDALCRKRADIEKAQKALSRVVSPDEAMGKLLEAKGETLPAKPVPIGDMMKRRGVGYTDLLMLYDLPEINADAMEQVEIMARYDGYIQKQKAQVEKFHDMESVLLPNDIDYMGIEGLRIEARQKLNAMRPESIGRAGRISGVSPADVAVLLVYLKARGAMEKANG